VQTENPVSEPSPLAPARAFIADAERPFSDAELTPYLAHALSLAKTLLSLREQT